MCVCVCVCNMSCGLWGFSVVKVTLANSTVTGGGLPDNTYESLQFHLHWGNGTTAGGSEHTVDGKRYPMEVGTLFSQ